MNLLPRLRPLPVSRSFSSSRNSIDDVQEEPQSEKIDNHWHQEYKQTNHILDWLQSPVIKYFSHNPVW